MRNWFTMKKVEDDEEGDDKKNPFAEIMIYDAIGKSFWDDDAVSASSFIAALADLGDVPEIKLRINSPGGDVFDGVAIYNAIKNHKAKVTAHVDGIAASAASFVAMAADKIVMPSNAFMLVHNASGFAMGQADDMLAVAADLQRIDKSMSATYAARTGQTAAKVKALMKEDRLMDATEAKALGYADEVTAPVKIAARFSMQLLPKAVADRFRAETGDEQGDPPPPAAKPEVPGEVPAPSPAPTIPPETAPTPEKPKISDPDPPPAPGDAAAAKQQGIAEHQAYVGAVSDLCTLAGAPELVGGYVRANATVEQVRKELLARRSTQTDVLPHHPLAAHAGGPTAPASAWTKITDKINARQK
jgi:ATP-dependent Clp endopeptidase proteolytic subunit ClpP